ncbi:MAG: type II toxin-antitoxin system RelE/ParE family toxin [Coriobacteriales bacterium]|jgi:mRNA interferase RelE/StbE|nr:type II toxin-antitoxin system RelE/ParE family toxin [Coriobacteriales bacterium]
MSWEIEFLPEADEEIDGLDGSVKKRALSIINRAAKNPLPHDEGGYGSPLRNTQEAKLAGLLKLKLKSSGLRVVYALKRTKTTMTVIVVGVREDSEVYREAEKRRIRYDL